MRLLSPQDQDLAWPNPAPPRPAHIFDLLLELLRAAGDVDAPLDLQVGMGWSVLRRWRRSRRSVVMGN